MHWRARLIRTGALALLLALVLAGCRVPRKPGGQGAGSQPPEVTTPAPAPVEQPAAEAPVSPPQPAVGVEAPAFTGEELTTGDEISFPSASAGRVAVLSFFSPG